MPKGKEVNKDKAAKDYYLVTYDYLCLLHVLQPGRSLSYYWQSRRAFMVSHI